MAKREEILRLVTDRVRLRHMSLRTEECYRYWIGQYCDFVRGVPFELPSEKKMEAFLTYLARDKCVSASTQNQAFHAVRFLYECVLNQRLGDIDALRAKRPVHTVTSTDHHSVVTAQLVGCGGRAAQSRERDVSEPMQTITGKADAALVRAFLVKYYATDQDPQLREPLHTVTTKDRFGLVTIKGEEFAIVDIGLRMLAPRELYRAQGFPESYVIGDDGRFGLTLTKSAQVRMCGNSVCPPMAAALVRANVPELAVWRRDEKRRGGLVA